LLQPVSVPSTPIRLIVRTTTVYALLALIPVPLLLAALKLMTVSVPSTHIPRLEPMTIRAHAKLVLLVLALLLAALGKVFATAIKTRMEMLKKPLPCLLVGVLLCALRVTSVAKMVHKLQLLILSLLLVRAPKTPTEMVPRARSALLTRRQRRGLLILLKLPSPLAIAWRTSMVMPRNIHALRALMAVCLLLRHPLPPLSLLLASARLTPMQPTELVPLVDAPLAAKMLLPQVKDPSPSLTVPALLARTVAPRHAFLALLVLPPLLVQLALLLAYAKKTSMETPQPVMPVLCVLIKVSNWHNNKPGAWAKLTLRLVCVLKEPGERILLLQPRAQLALWGGLLGVRLLMISC